MIEITRQVSDITIGKLNPDKLLKELQTPLSLIDEWDPGFNSGNGYSTDAQVVRGDRLWASNVDSNTEDPLINAGNEWREILSKVKIVSLYNSNASKFYEPTIGEVIRIYVDVALDAAEIVIMDNLIAVHNPLDISFQIRKTYEAREKDGINYFNQIHDEIVLDVMTNVITETAAFVIEAQLEDCFNKIKTGDWKTAKNRFEIITNVSPPPNFDSYTQGIFDGITVYIDNYITANYE